jgi:phosphohistidine phosphatase
MEIYFLRHANAGRPKINREKDEQRPLDKVGIEQCHVVGRALASLGVKPDVIISSPLVRARETASIVADEIGHREKIVLDDAMRPDAEYSDFQQLLARYKSADTIMVVGHNPSETGFLNRLVTGNSSEAIELKKGAVARIDYEPGKQPVLKWAMPPKVVRAIQEDSANSSRPKMVSK